MEVRSRSPPLSYTVQMASSLQDVGMMTYGHSDEPSVSAISQPSLQPSESVLCQNRQLIRAEMIS